MLLNTPEIKQLGNYDCGRACAEIVLGYYGVPPADAAGMLGRLRVCRHDGTDPGELAGWFRNEGWLVSEGWMDIATVKHHGDEGRPVILLATIDSTGHWVVSRGVSRNTIHLQDPFAGRVKYPVATFESLWHDYGRYAKFLRWAVVAVPPG